MSSTAGNPLKVCHLNAYLIPTAADFSLKTQKTVEYIEKNEAADIIAFNEIFDFPVGITGRILLYLFPNSQLVAKYAMASSLFGWIAPGWFTSIYSVKHRLIEAGEKKGFMYHAKSNYDTHKSGTRRGLSGNIKYVGNGLLILSKHKLSGFRELDFKEDYDAAERGALLVDFKHCETDITLATLHMTPTFGKGREKSHGTQIVHDEEYQSCAISRAAQCMELKEAISKRPYKNHLLITGDLNVNFEKDHEELNHFVEQWGVKYHKHEEGTVTYKGTKDYEGRGFPLPPELLDYIVWSDGLRNTSYTVDKSPEASFSDHWGLKASFAVDL